MDAECQMVASRERGLAHLQVELLELSRARCNTSPAIASRESDLAEASLPHGNHILGLHAVRLEYFPQHRRGRLLAHNI